MLPRQVSQAMSSTAGVSAMMPPKSVPQPGLPSTTIAAPPIASTASAACTLLLSISFCAAQPAVTSAATASVAKVELPKP